MLDYKLAKQLKEAGFDQKYPDVKHSALGQRYWMYDESDNDYIDIIHDGYGSNALDEEDLTLIPTLSELIDACGDKFAGLTPEKEGWDNPKTIGWEASGAYSGSCIGEAIIIKNQKTPEEAVAHLWLKLNKK